MARKEQYGNKLHPHTLGVLAMCLCAVGLPGKLACASLQVRDHHSAAVTEADDIRRVAEAANRVDFEGGEVRLRGGDGLLSPILIQNKRHFVLKGTGESARLYHEPDVAPSQWALGRRYGPSDRVESNGAYWICVRRHKSAEESEPGTGVVQHSFWRLDTLQAELFWFRDSQNIVIEDLYVDGQSGLFPDSAYQTRQVLFVFERCSNVVFRRNTIKNVAGHVIRFTGRARDWSEEEIAKLWRQGVIKRWKPGNHYKPGEILRHREADYRVVTGHYSSREKQPGDKVSARYWSKLKNFSWDYPSDSVASAGLVVTGNEFENVRGQILNTKGSGAQRIVFANNRIAQVGSAVVKIDGERAPLDGSVTGRVIVADNFVAGSSTTVPRPNRSSLAFVAVEESVDNVVVARNIVKGLRYPGWPHDASGYGGSFLLLREGQTRGPVRNIHVHGNSVEDTDIFFASSNPIVDESTGQRVAMENFIISGNTVAGVHDVFLVAALRNLTVSQNSFSDAANYYFRLGSEASRITVRNNRFFALATTPARPFVLLDPTPKQSINEVVVVDNQMEGALKSAIVVSGGRGAISDLKLERNLVSGGGGPGVLLEHVVSGTVVGNVVANVGSEEEPTEGIVARGVSDVRISANRASGRGRSVSTVVRVTADSKDVWVDGNMDGTGGKGRVIVECQTCYTND